MIPFLDDHPAGEDALNFDRTAGILGDILLGVTPLPFTMGIFGPWGSGKTTLMRLVEKKLEKKCHTVWFNPWKYDTKETLTKAFLKVIHDAVWESNELNEAMLKDVATRVGDWVGTSFLGKPLGSIFFQTFNLEPAYINLLEETTRTLIGRYVGKNGRLAVFIDDLDRCLPENAILVLETLKLYLDHTQTAFILGADRNVIEQALLLRYPTMEVSGKDYLEKIVQVGYSLPRPRAQDLRRFLANCSFPTGTDSHITAGVVFVGAGLNMRLLKRLVNQLNLVCALSGQTQLQDQNAAMATKLLVLQNRFPTFFRLVEDIPENLLAFQTLIGISQDQEQERFLQEHPYLKEHFENKLLAAFFRQTTGVHCHDTEVVRQWLHYIVLDR